MSDLVTLSAVALVAGVLRGVTGFGFALAAAPLFSLTVAPLNAVMMAHLLQIAAGPVDFLQSRRSIDRRALALLCAGSIALTPVAAMLATRLPEDVMRLAIAVFVLLGLSVLLSRITLGDSRALAAHTGALAGLLGGPAAMPGPPAVAYFMGRGTPKATSRATLLLFFGFTALLALGAIAISSDALDVGVFVLAAASLPALFPGTWLGTRAFNRLGEGHYRLAALGVLAISALLSGARGLSGLVF